MKTKEVLMTPELAEEILRRNTSNRNVSKKSVERMVDAMKRDDWKYNGETIKIGKDGKLLDGQHRLTAIVQSGCACKMLVVEGVDDDVIDTIDIGKNRTFGDWLHISGESNCSMLSATLHKLSIYLEFYREGRYVTGRGGSARKSYQHYERLLRENPDVRTSVERISKNDARKLFDGSTMAVMHYLFSDKDEAAADSFFGSLASGANLDIGNPILVLRQKGLHWKANNTKPELYEVMLFFTRAWNAYVRGSTIEHLRFNSAESFPNILAPLKEEPKTVIVKKSAAKK